MMGNNFLCVGMPDGSKTRSLPASRGMLAGLDSGVVFGDYSGYQNSAGYGFGLGEEC